MKLITTITNPHHRGYLQFKRSLDYYEWNYEVIVGNYTAFGSKMINAYEYALKSKDDYLFITDAYDVFMLSTMEEAASKIHNTYNTLDLIIFNAEKGCWPYGQWDKLYPEVSTPWKYLNGGAAFVNRLFFIKMFEENPIKHEDNDQVNLAKIYLTARNKYNMHLDTGCNAFQSIAFEEDNDFVLSEADHSLYNKKTDTYPIVIHANGRTDMNKIYKLI